MGGRLPRDVEGQVFSARKGAITRYRPAGTVGTAAPEVVSAGPAAPGTVKFGPQERLHRMAQAHKADGGFKIMFNDKRYCDDYREVHKRRDRAPRHRVRTKRRRRSACAEKAAEPHGLKA